MDEITAALNFFNSKGTFFSKREANFNNFDIKVNKVGVIDYPIKKSQIKELIGIAKPAKFGWKDQTIQDDSVRKVWEIPKNKVKIGKRQWDSKFKPLLETIKVDLGFPEQSSLTAELHNLLIYEPGHFFKPHQDSEKADNMVATLVVILPSEYEGGELIVNHNGVKKSFKFKVSQLKKLSCVAFFSDCYHEVKKIESGYRVTLTYNLLLENYKGEIGVLYEQDFCKKLEKAFTNYFIDEVKKKKRSKDISPRKVVYLLDHQYTQKGLSWDKLKNADRGRVDALLKTADDLGLEAHLVLADMQETWDCEFDYDSYRCRRRHYHDDEEEAIPTYIICTDVVLKHWINRQGEKVEYKELSVKDEELCWTGENEGFEPFDSEYEGWTGNAGNTLDRWYHRAAIVLWCKRDEVDNILKKKIK